MRTSVLVMWAAIVFHGCSSSSGGTSSSGDGGSGDSGGNSHEDSGGTMQEAGTDAPASSMDAGNDVTDGAPHDAPSTVDAPAPCGSTGVSCTTRQSVASRIVLPKSASDLAIDLDGDGHPDNQYGAILAALSSQGFMPQANQDAAVTQGQDLVLLDESSVDPSFANDPGAAVSRVLQATPNPTPDFSGTGSFTVDTSVAPGSYQGPIVSGVFSSAPDAPSVTAPAVLHMPLVTLAPSPIVMPLYAAHLTVQSTAGKPTAAQVNGAYKASDIQTILFPAVVAALTASIQADAGSSQQIEQIFDVGDGNGGPCTNPDGSMSQPNDGVIGACEVAGNSLVQSLFAPDVQLFDASGNYHPVPGGTSKDSLSVGFSLTLVGATF